MKRMIYSLLSLLSLSVIAAPAVQFKGQLYYSEPAHSWLRSTTATALYAGSVLYNQDGSASGTLTGSVLVKLKTNTDFSALKPLQQQSIGHNYLLLQFAPERELGALLAEVLAYPGVIDAELELQQNRLKPR